MGPFLYGFGTQERGLLRESDLGWLAWKHHREAPLKRIIGAGLKPNIHGEPGDKMSVKCW